ncbi:hypothetical protein NHX12_031400 [Muraenolepis orangiensis]|uniref:VWFC domain-containing protein n=1 Tax=Muraenolepis orangiensis TaxID=630683 RepID=A0A9Q0IKK2_9TELE|nr:hypothetical protein NHX12_031400 [Muraenolepis orangiensis]
MSTRNSPPCSFSVALLLVSQSLQVAIVAEYSSNTDLDYEFGDYRGKWCMDDHGFVYGIGELYYPSPTACPCTCTVDGPVCVRPQCPRIHPRCTRIAYKACCAVCEAVAKVCVYGGRTYRLLEEFRVSRCERCRCEANREVYCSVSDCPAPHCVNPSFEPNHCCPMGNMEPSQCSLFSYAPPYEVDVELQDLQEFWYKCQPVKIIRVYRSPSKGPNCFAGSKIIPAGERVDMDDNTVCFCTYHDSSWHIHPQATCEHQPQDSAPPATAPQNPRRTDEQHRARAERAFSPKLDAIP